MENQVWSLVDVENWKIAAFVVADFAGLFVYSKQI
jgi:hypothetical protein